VRVCRLRVSVVGDDACTGGSEMVYAVAFSRGRKRDPDRRRDGTFRFGMSVSGARTKPLDLGVGKIKRVVCPGKSDVAAAWRERTRMVLWEVEA